MNNLDSKGVALKSLDLKRQYSALTVEVCVVVGRARPTLKDLLSLTQDSVLPLDRSVSDPVELYLGGKLIARGVLEEIEDDELGRIAIRLLEVSRDHEGI